MRSDAASASECRGLEAAVDPGGDAVDGCGCRGLVGPVEVAVLGAGLEGELDGDAAGGEGRREQLARDAEFVDLAVHDERRREADDVRRLGEARRRGERCVVGGAAEVLLVHAAHAVGAEPVGRGVRVERGAQLGPRRGLHREQGRVGEEDAGGQGRAGRGRCPAEQPQHGARHEVAAGAGPADRDARRVEAELLGVVECPRPRREHVVGAGGVATVVVAGEAVVDRDDGDAPRGEGACQPIGLGHVEVARDEAAAVRPHEARRRAGRRGIRRVHPHEAPGRAERRLLRHRLRRPSPPARRRRGRRRSWRGSRMPRRRPSGRRAGRATRATRRGPGARRCRTRP